MPEEKPGFHFIGDIILNAPSSTGAVEYVKDESQNGITLKAGEDKVGFTYQFDNPDSVVYEDWFDAKISISDPASVHK
ncbi:hypothetical protein [Mucilaginibacter paludis]|uniref:Uncharacterized protein n=1 Tax=Mucilaginibacter paludis DSM 18603 TaxID=714943 RepID=H1YBX5_9SPHI|nr:hypothetical protein [Mucilaginibacter paludis]EHQ27053.1 hypothetical protein Mucpa_2945 [Mucilaginibacter paludis DSM 18603]